MRVMSLVPLFVVAACAGTPGGGAPAPISQSVAVVGPSGSSSTAIAGINNSNVQTLPNTLDQVWRAMPMVFDSLGVPVATLDAASHTIGNPAFAIRRRLKNVPLSRYIDCGSSQGGPSADDYDVRLSVMVELHPAQTGTMMTTTVSANARPVNYAQDFGACTSRGGLEARINDLVRRQLPK